MAQEVEAKFRLSSKPDLPDDSGKEIRQGYLDYKNNELVKAKIKEAFGDIDLESIKEARVRAKGSGENTRYFFTLKSDGTLQRDEYEEEVTEDTFEEMWGEASLGKISKIRYEIDLGDGLIAEVDDYREDLEGLLSLEVEFDPSKYDLEQIRGKVSYIDSTAEDVTEIRSFKNRELARTKNLEDLEAKVKSELEDREANEARSELRRV